MMNIAPGPGIKERKANRHARCHTDNCSGVCNSRDSPGTKKFRASRAASPGEIGPHHVKADHISVIVYTTIRIYDLSYIRKNKYVKCIVTLDTHIVTHSYTNLGIMNLVANEYKEPVEPTNVAKAANAI